MVPADDTMLTHLRRGSVEYVVLALLEHEELYGFDIARRLGDDGVLMQGEGTLYPLLARLRKHGWVETSWRESTEGPPRRYYGLTAAGRESLHTFRTTWKTFRDAVDAALETGETR